MVARSSVNLRAAVIGCGRIGAFTRKEIPLTLPKHFLPINHCAAVSATPGVTLVAVCDINQSSATRASALYRVSHSYADYREMIKEQKPDIVTIATRTEHRPDIIKYAASNGVRGIYIEKPISRSLGAAKSAMRVVQSNGVSVAYGTYSRYLKVHRGVRDYIASGALGALKQIVVNYGRSGLLWGHPHSVSLLAHYAGRRRVEFV